MSSLKVIDPAMSRAVTAAVSPGHPSPASVALMPALVTQPEPKLQVPVRSPPQAATWPHIEGPPTLKAPPPVLGLPPPHPATIQSADATRKRPSDLIPEASPAPAATSRRGLPPS